MILREAVSVNGKVTKTKFFLAKKSKKVPIHIHPNFIPSWDKFTQNRSSSFFYLITNLKSFLFRKKLFLSLETRDRQ